MASVVLHDRLEEHIVQLILNRPEALNALNREMVRALNTRLEEIEKDPSIWVVILTGRGTAFCAGVDLKERSSWSEEELYQHRNYELLPLFRRLQGLSKPLIAAVNGHAFGGGMELALSCDIILASDKAQFGQREVKWGIIPMAGGCQILPRLVGLHRAKELILTGRIVSAPEAQQLGLVNRCVPHDSLLVEALSLAREIQENSPLAVMLAKKCVQHGMDYSPYLDYDLQASNICYRAPDAREGLAAFNQKRKPRWTGVVW